jgi:radical SAM superfamily enzyme YgiQ (UPF0313 family)
MVMKSASTPAGGAAPDETFLYQPQRPTQPDALRMAFFYPADYTVSMAALGYLLLFALLDQRADVAVDRVPLDQLQRFKDQPYELIGVSFAFELDIIHILTGLSGFGLPLMAAARNETHPLVFAGGPVPTTNPEPYADFFDFFLVGDGETVLPAVAAFLRTHRHVARAERLLRLASAFDGVYVPALYAIHYASPTGPIRRIEPLHPEAPFPVRRASVTDMDAFVATSPILSPHSVYGKSFLVEVRRGCAHRCRFCLASYSTLPAKSASVDAIWQAIEAGLAHTDHIGLLGALIADHPEFEELCNRLQARMNQGAALRISTASLRADTLTRQMVETFAQGQQQQVTLAIESGAQGLRQRINKHLNQDAIFQAADTLLQGGMSGLKLYTMIGLPTETDDDVEQTVALARALRKAHPKLKLTVGCSSFVPKAATPFQWQARTDQATLQRRQAAMVSGLRNVAQYRPNSLKWDRVQALFARGDRRLAPWLVQFWQHGGGLGAVNRTYKAMAEQLPPMAYYVDAPWDVQTVLPWQTLHLGVDASVLWQEAQLSLSKA